MKLQHILLVLLFLMSLPFGLDAQNALHREKQSPHYIFGQVNTSLSYSSEDGIGLANENPPSQLALTYGFKNLAAMQRGIIKTVALDQVKVSAAVIYFPGLTTNYLNVNTGDSVSISESNINLALKNAEFKFKTKYDRTSFSVGYFGLPYGRSPKISSEFSLIPGLAGSDFKFSKDLGVKASFPVLENLDVQVAFTLGGLLSAPLMNFSFVDDGLLSYGLYAPGSYNYNGNWLLTATGKTPNFSKKDMGVSVAMGKILSSHKGIRSNANVFKVAPFIALKSSETSIFTNQLSFGYTNYSFAKTTQITWISQYEHLISGGWASFVAANRLKRLTDRGETTTTNRLVAGINLYPIPMLTIRINATLSMDLGDSEIDFSQQFGSFFQVIYGFGRKP